MISRQKIKIVICILLNISTQPVYSTCLIFDLENVLVYMDQKTIFDQLGWVNTMQYALKNYQNPFELVKVVYDILDKIEATNIKTNASFPKKQGNKLPLIAQRLFCGKINHQTLLREALIKIEQLNEEHFFKSDQEYKLIEKLLGILFHPHIFVSCIKPNPTALKLLEKVAKHTAHTHKKYRLMILAEWFPDSFDALYEAPHLKPLFSFFKKENIVFTYDFKGLKQTPSTFKSFLKKYDLNPKECLVIDGNKSTIKLLNDLGIDNLPIKNGRLAPVERELKKRKLL